MCPLAWLPFLMSYSTALGPGSRFTDVRSFTYMPRGGHFAAFEEPQLMAQDIIQFGEKVESKDHK